MNKEIDVFKIANYDKFSCIADKCKFTCCSGWDISIDSDTYNRWQKEYDKFNYILNNVKTKKCGRKIEYFMDKETSEDCPCLDKQGLCQIVKSHGEGCLSLTCHTFPRIENVFEDRKELSLSCACPEVVRLIETTNGKIAIVLENNIDLEDKLLELKIRKAIINIINTDKFLLEHKLILSFEMLLNILDSENLGEDTIVEQLETYNNKQHMQKLINRYKKIGLNTEESIEELNYLFLDIIQNYKEVPILKSLFEDVSGFAENIEIESVIDKWHDYKRLFVEHNKLVENCIIYKILSSAVSSDIEDMIISFQMIILEYLLVRYAVFLKYCINDEINSEDIKDYIVAFSRIIGNNTEAMIEFFKDGFGEEVLEMGYMCFISLF